MRELVFKNFGIAPENNDLKNHINEVFSELYSFGDLRLRAAVLYYGTVSNAAKAFNLAPKDFTALIEPPCIISEETNVNLQDPDNDFQWDYPYNHTLDERVRAEFVVAHPSHMYRWMDFEEAATLIRVLPDAERMALFSKVPSKRSTLYNLVSSWKKDARLTHISAAFDMVWHYLVRWHLRTTARHHFECMAVDRYLKLRKNIEELSTISCPCSVAVEIFQEYDTYFYNWTETRKFIKKQRIYAASHRSQFIDLVAKRDGSYLCRVCGSDDRIVLDHIIAVSQGGLSEQDNFQLLCTPCNQKKARGEGAMIL